MFVVGQTGSSASHLQALHGQTGSPSLVLEGEEDHDQEHQQEDGHEGDDADDQEVEVWLDKEREIRLLTTISHLRAVQILYFNNKAGARIDCGTLSR